MLFSYLFKILYYDQCTYYILNYKNYLLISNKMKENKFIFMSNFKMEVVDGIYKLLL